MSRIIWILVLFIEFAYFSSGLLLAKASEPKSSGLLIEFADDTVSSQRNQIHSKYQMKLVYRSETLPVDSIVPIKSYHISDTKYLNKLCEKYRIEIGVLTCEINRIYPLIKEKVLDRRSIFDHTGRSYMRSLSEGLLNLSRLIFSPGSRKCELVRVTGLPQVHEGLSPLWSQEYIGAGLARKLVRQTVGTSEIRIANVDAGVSRSHLTGKISDDIDWDKLKNGIFKYHGTSVANLINGREPIGVAEKGLLSDIIDVYTHLTLLPAVDQISRSKPSLVNLEIHTLCELTACRFPNFEAPTILKRLIKQMTENSIVVAAAGNHHPYGSITDASDGLDLILVGNLNSYGIVDGDSDESENVVITGPAGGRQMTENAKGLYPRFGGTSGATPLVTGAIANVKAILSDLSFDEVKVLLQKTAIPTSNIYQQPLKNGAGMLNAFKLVRVALRLKELGWPEFRSELLAADSSFDFREDATNLRREARSLIESENCNDQQRALEMLRKSFLLMPDETTGNLLAEIYEQEGFLINAQFYWNFNEGTLKQFLDIVTDSSDDPTLPLTLEDRRAIKRAKNSLSFQLAID